ncbi:hypothetical protein CONPUDRAFT_160584 [Coniophora puteana RWD-64-598 SS2]|uniref:CxC2-like cysteine cluster KDZ transposase-associated domain-containing protein n=1 Tax=Coniophora puteana (strain RWD-64-598) TaxID=741705 RepID=R7SCL5_CONPW|nr:uncharacterized protein CONPUDRAFT_160584 [Coniophora puteana RWD-64-598 SS2]EIW73903.1 hypothetical protein CONPUDRAFT_160584 [Coniophora puteana RWD-64-598 SS2]
MGPDSGTGRKGVGPAVGKVPKSTGGKGRQAVGRVVEKGKKEVKRMYEAVTKKRGRTKTVRFEEDMTDADKPQDRPAKRTRSTVEDLVEDIIPTVEYQVPPKKTIRPRWLQCDLMAKWLKFQDKYLSKLLDMERRSSGDNCPTCQGPASTWRCLSCLGTPEGCTTCMRKAHRLLPFHQVEHWEADHWEATTTAQLGVKLYMGHGGDCCPHLTEADASTANDDDADDDDWEDEDFPEGQDEEEPIVDVDSAPADFNLGRRYTQFTRTETSASKKHRRHLIVVDKSGVYEFPVVWCACGGTSKDEQLFDMRLYPASQQYPRTAFTFEVLDDFLICNFESKEPAHAYFRRLIRLSNEAFPDSVPDRYRELMRCARQWLRLTTRKEEGHGFGQSAMEEAIGSLAPFCVACPQPGVNLDENWKENGPEWLYYGRILVDGNFKQQSYAKRRPENDVALADGLGYTVDKAKYAKHIATAKDIAYPSTCNDYRAISQAGRRHNHLAVSGLAALVCARHGVWFPNSVVDFVDGGERQIYTDYALCMVIWQLCMLPKIIVFYDIICQYLIKFFQRIAAAPELSLPPGVQIIPAIGMFHVHGHRELCFARYNPDHIWGAAIVSGEIIESNWSPMNRSAESMKRMSAWARIDWINGLMRSTNQKKNYRAVKTVTRSWPIALKRYQAASKDLADIVAVCNPDSVSQWSHRLTVAYSNRPTNVAANDDVFKVRVLKLASRSDHSHQVTDVQKSASPLVRWINKGIDVEQLQIDVQVLCRKMEKRVIVGEARQRDALRKKLLVEMGKFLEDAPTFMAGLLMGADFRAIYQLEIAGAGADTLEGSPEDGKELDPDAEEETDIATLEPETRTIGLPSAFGRERCIEHGLQFVLDTELKLRTGQAHDAIGKIQSHIGRRSVMYRKDIRAARGSQHQGASARARLDTETAKVDLQRLYYNHARNAMLTLAEDPATFSKYQVMTQADLKSCTAELRPDQTGIRHEGLSWFWTLDIERELAGPGGDELLNEFARMHWTRAQCRTDRAKEELTILRHEMKWIPKAWSHQAEKWKALSQTDAGKADGHHAYARRREVLATRLSAMAQSVFQDLLARRPPPTDFNIGLDSNGDTTWKGHST